MALDSVFVTDASTLGITPGGLGLSTIRDPWNRKIPNGSIKCAYNEGDVTTWIFITTVEGHPVECRIFNT